MFKKPLFGETFVLLMIVGILNFVATTYHLYWSVYEFDSIVHFLAGGTLALFFLWLYFFSGFFNPAKRSLAIFLLVSILGTMFIAVSWEIYELIFGEAVIQKADYPYDTMMDLVTGFLGALAACFYGYLKQHES